MDIYLLLYLVFIIAPAGAVIHEGGHLLGAASVQANHISLSIGTGREIISFSCRQVRITIHLFFFLGGLAQSEREKPYTPLEIIWITVAGILSSGLFAVIFYLVYNTYGNAYVNLFYLFNGWLAVANSIPFKMKDKQSDGYVIYKILQNRSKTDL